MHVKIKFIVEFAQNKARYVAMDLNIKCSIKSHKSFEEHEKKFRKYLKHKQHTNSIRRCIQQDYHVCDACYFVQSSNNNKKSTNISLSEQ